ncbi:MAG: phage holin family protein [Clostridia bacterium]|nr:phage holin family protein [Clostridia bacterium]
MTWDKVLKALAAITGALAGLFGEWNTALTILVIVMAMDYITGVIVAVMHRSPKTDGGGLSSKVGFIGLARKGFMILIVLLATLLDRAVGNSAMVFQTAMVFYYIANEGLSILENADLIGAPFPTFLRERLESMQEEKQKPPEG